MCIYHVSACLRQGGIDATVSIFSDYSICSTNVSWGFCVLPWSHLADYSFNNANKKKEKNKIVVYSHLGFTTVGMHRYA